MTARKLLLAAGVLMLAGCAAEPYYYGDGSYRTGYYDGYAYRDTPYTYYSYGPGYYVEPSVSFGLSYSNGYYRRHRWYG